MMTAGEIVDMACSEAGMTDDESRAFALVQVDKWHRHICQQELWRDMIEEGKFLVHSSGLVSLPSAVDKVLAIRTDQTSLPYASTFEYWRSDPLTFNQTGNPLNFVRLPPAVIRYVDATTDTTKREGGPLGSLLQIRGYQNTPVASGNVVINIPDISGIQIDLRYITEYGDIETARAGIVPASIASGTYWASGYFYLLNTTSRMIQPFLRGAAVLDCSLVEAQSFHCDLFFFNAPYSTTTPQSTITFSDRCTAGSTVFRRRQNIKIVPAYTDSTKYIRILFKRATNALTADGSYPDLDGCENVLTAFVKSALLRMDKRGDEANEALQEANALLMQLKQVAVAQEANHQQLTPADGIGCDWQGNPELWNSFKV